MVARRFRQHARPLRRRRAYLEPRPKILIVCEGAVTEPGYFNALRQEARNRLVEVVIDDEGGVPKTLVERASQRKKAAAKEAERLRDDNIAYDEVWCVFDVDEHPNLPDARQQARDNGIELAISNPCFELWLVLHFCDQNAHVERKPLCSLLRKHIPRYRKEVVFEIFKPGHEDAIRRAKQLEKRRIDDGNEGGNPSTRVYRLVERIEEFRRVSA
jgi:hypothetical protein